MQPRRGLIVVTNPLLQLLEGLAFLLHVGSLATHFG